MTNKKTNINKKASDFLNEYINNPSPTGFESKGQKIWLNYIKPYIDDYFIDTYGTVVGVVNPNAEYKVVMKHMWWYLVCSLHNERWLHLLEKNGDSDLK